MFTIAIEGLCFAGKSTLSTGLASHFLSRPCVILKDYSDLSGPNRPSVPALSLAHELRAFSFYLEIDRRRWRPVIAECEDVKIVIQDRCFHTLLAHSYSNGILQGFNALSKCRQLLNEASDLVRPDIILYLDVYTTTLLGRYTTIRNNLPAIFKDPAYMLWYRDYFLSHCALDGGELCVIDANVGIDAVKERALNVLEGFGI